MVGTGDEVGAGVFVGEGEAVFVGSGDEVGAGEPLGEDVGVGEDELDRVGDGDGVGEDSIACGVGIGVGNAFGRGVRGI